MKPFPDKDTKLNPRIAAWSSLLWFYARSNKVFMRTFIASVMALCAGAFFAGGYYYSQYHFEELMAGFEQLSERYNLPYEGMSWAARFSAVQLRTEVANKTVEQIKEYLHEKDQQIKELEEHLYFYRTVIAPEDEEKALSIFSVNLQWAAERRVYPIEVVLRNHRSKKGTVKGGIKVLVEGAVEPQGAMLVRDDLLEGEIKFSFKYFQRLKGTLRLPGSFSPNQLSVVVKADKVKGVKETYAWAELFANKE